MNDFLENENFNSNNYLISFLDNNNNSDDIRRGIGMSCLTHSYYCVNNSFRMK